MIITTSEKLGRTVCDAFAGMHTCVGAFEVDVTNVEGEVALVDLIIEGE